MVAIGRILDSYAGFAIGETPTYWLNEFKKLNQQNKGFGNIWQNSKDAWKNTSHLRNNGTFWSRTVEQIKPQGWVDDFANFSKNGSKFSAGFKCLGKRMPLIGSLVAVGFEVPNLWHAFTDKENGGGIGTGLLETGKASLKLGAMAAGFAAGAAIGTAICPGLGTAAGAVVGGIVSFVGGILGSIGASKVADGILGKSFTEKKEEKQEKLAKQQEEQQQQMQMGYGGMTNPFSSPFANTYDMYGIDPYASPMGMFA